jgi:hypothetical protein
MCPQVTTIRIKGKIFYTLLRPEYVKSYPIPLSSDAWSWFVVSTPMLSQSIPESVIALVIITEQ